jgi:hypothetical protein
MGVGFPAKYATEIVLHGSRAAARDSIVATFELLGWHIEVAAPDTYVAKVGMTGGSWGETVTVSLANEGMLEIRSTCYFQVIDWGKNRRNVNQFLELFSARNVRNTEFERDKKSDYLDAAGATPLDRLLNDDGVIDTEESKSGSRRSTRDSP